MVRLHAHNLRHSAKQRELARFLRVRFRSSHPCDTVSECAAHQVVGLRSRGLCRTCESKHQRYAYGYEYHKIGCHNLGKRGEMEGKEHAAAYKYDDGRHYSE